MWIHKLFVSVLGWTSIKHSSDTGMRISEDGDVVLADRGFTIEDDVAMCGAKLEIPGERRNFHRKRLSDRNSYLLSAYM